MVLQRETATRDGKFLDVIAAVDFEIHHGKITEVTVYQGLTPTSLTSSGRISNAQAFSALRRHQSGLGYQ